MFLEDIAGITGISLKALEHAARTLGIDPGAKIGDHEWSRIRAYLVAHYGYTQDLAQQVQQPVRRAVAVGQPGRLNLAAFGGTGGLAGQIQQRRGNWRLDLERRTRNCGDTAGLVLSGLKTVAKVHCEQGVAVRMLLASLEKPCTEHEVWDITIHQHTFVLERMPGGRNLIVQAYQPGYNVQFWLRLAEPYRDESHDRKNLLTAIRDAWQRPTDQKLIELVRLIEALLDATERPARKVVWEAMPFNPNDSFLALGDIIVTVNRYRFLENAEADVCIRALIARMKEVENDGDS